ncbi:tyrosine-type recombinase/integrase [Ruminococcus albus]|uniref:Site-specific recombinase XerD n=1 Tax=Ruminococcus albus TaxID=1264 RepID=A0A1H7PJH0_RUMAL|nr:tyrosine-type recombinase/integrase [Ruminococcus albus]SEL35931.1 Site-specific recombinase XerD [Ruminococcus albus]
MSSKSKIIAIEKAIYTGCLDILEFTFSANDKTFFDYFSDPKHSEVCKSASIDLHFIEDILLRRKIVEYLYHCMDSKKINPNTFYSYRIRGILQIREKYPYLYNFNYNEFLQNATTRLKAEKRLGRAKAFLYSFSRYCEYIEHIDNLFMLDTWEIEWFNLSMERDYARRFRRLCFSGVNNDRNRFLLKRYIEYCLRNTDNSLNTIMGKNSTLKNVLNFIERPIDEWDNESSKSLVSILLNRYRKKETLASRLITLFHFIDYLLLHDYLADNPMKQYKDLARIGEFHHKTTSVDHSVVKQIFYALGSIEDKRIVICFLLIYCTGMRLSEACNIKTNCTERTEAGSFVHYYSLKMKKDVCNVIPESLYDMIEEYRISRKEENFLFPSRKKGIAMSATYFYNHMREALREKNVLNPDGSPYHFTAHAFRHLMAVRMREQDIPFTFIQEQLHHASPEMTLAYVEYIDRVKIHKMENFIKTHDSEQYFDREADVEYVEYMRANLRAQILPDGLCCRPIKLGKCLHYNSCLTCPDYRTSKKHLNDHKNHLNRINQYIIQCQKNGWLPQLESSKVIRDRLIQIISKLEEDSDPK